MSILKKFVARFSTPSSFAARIFDVSTLKTQRLPQEFWIELTSKCPFDCVFCSRAALRGKGEHMDFQLYKKLIAQMYNPRVIRLNYSGESIHYPHLSEAIALAKSTGARVELVTVLSSAKPAIIESLVKEQLDRLTISIHALSEPLYQQIYGHSTVTSLRENLMLLQSFKKTYGSHLPLIDFAFVAMERNLHELPLVLALANDSGVRQIDIHPVIRRDDIPETFSQELIAGNLTSHFRLSLSQTLYELEAAYPHVDMNVSNKELEETPCLGAYPIAYPPVLPEGAKIFSCEQNPWDTVHILANGDFVSCEVRDQISLGNLSNADLHSIWHGESYQMFRRNYSAGMDEKCRHCIYKLAYLSDTAMDVKSYFRPDECQQQLLKGWHFAESHHVWSSTNDARVVLARSLDATHLVITGVLPPSRKADVNVLKVSLAGAEHKVKNSSENNLPFKLEILLPQGVQQFIIIDFNVSHVFTPQQQSTGRDARQLGFLLSEIKCL
jgi:radical SAM protein with 4Fe4S-binding SPASM domain